jgi:K+-sensing histidine kinase KdpD
MIIENEKLELITHDLKSPLTVLMGTIDFLSMELNDLNKNNSDIKNSFKVLKQTSKNMRDMIDSILVMSLIEDEQALVEPKLITNLTYQLREYAKSFKYEMYSKKIKFKTYIQRNLPEVSWDFKRVKNHILNNIITNSIKFTPKDGTIKISAFEDVNDLVIVIEDSGPGIPAKERENIFNKRKKLNTQVIRTNKSFGLGLYNAYYFTKLHNGIISVTDSSFESGVAFVVRLPINK